MSTETVVRLKLADKASVPTTKENMLKCFEEDVLLMREWLTNTDGGGYAFVAYDKRINEGRNELQSRATYFAAEPADGFWLPDMLKVRIYQRIHEEE